MRYVTVPAPISLVNPATDDVSDKACGFAEVARFLLLEEHVARALDVFARNDLRMKLTRAPVGAVVELSDAEYDALKEVVDRPTQLGPAFLYAPGGVDMLRAIKDAPTRDPRTTAA